MRSKSAVWTDPPRLDVCDQRRQNRWAPRRRSAVTFGIRPGTDRSAAASADPLCGSRLA
jgi:hypothetical protein